MLDDDTRRGWNWRRLLGLLWLGLAYGLSIGVAALLVLAYFAPRVSPLDSVWFAYLGLIAPFLYVANLVLLLCWTVCWRRIAIVLGVVALLGIGKVPRYFRPTWARTVHYQRPIGSLRILSYNVEGFFGRDSLGERENQLSAIADFIRKADPDVFCMQEFELNRINPRYRCDSLFGAWKHNVFFFTSGSAEANGRGLAIYSKYPLIRRGGIHYPKSANASMWVDMIVHRDTVRIYNNHMQSTQVNAEDRDYLGGRADTIDDERVKDILRKLGRNFKVRAAQADSVAAYIHDGTPRVIVCGDFNDTPMSYTYRKMRGRLVDAFCRKGRGAVYTYRGLLELFRIDYLFHSRDFVTLYYDPSTARLSDHNPVVVDLKLK